MRIDFLSFIGIVVAFAAILGGNWLEGGHISALVNGPAIVIVLGGTVGAILLQTPIPVFLHAMRMAGQVFIVPRQDLLETINFQLLLAGPLDLLPDDGAEITVDRLDGLPFISLDPFATYQESVERTLSAAGVAVRFTCETSSVLTAARLVALGVGCAFLDPFVARTMASPTVGISRVSPAITQSYGIFGPSNTPVGEETAQVLDNLRAVVRDHGQDGVSIGPD